MFKNFIDKLLGKPAARSRKNPFGKREELPASVHGIDPNLVDERAVDVVRTLKKGGIIWTAADQSFHGKQSAFIPFFGVPCTTNLAIPILARMGNAVVLPYYVRRTGTTYEVIIHPPLDNLPSGDDIADTARLVHVLENEIRAEPNAYLWGHRRYKNRAPDEPRTPIEPA